MTSSGITLDINLIIGTFEIKKKKVTLAKTHKIIIFCVMECTSVSKLILYKILRFFLNNLGTILV